MLRKVACLVILIFAIGGISFAAQVKVREALPSEYGLMVRSAIYGVEFKVRKDTKVAEYRGQTFYFDSRKELQKICRTFRKGKKSFE